MTTKNGRIPAIALLATVAVSTGLASNASSPALASGNATAVGSTSEILAIERASKGQLLAIGRLDAVSSQNSTASVLGQNFALLPTAANRRFLSEANAGEAVLLIGTAVGDKYLVHSALVINGLYVPGASKIFLRGQISGINPATGSATVGGLRLEAAGGASAEALAAAARDRDNAIIGIQPNISGTVLVEEFLSNSAKNIASSDASLGTGRPDASLGTGRPDASLGTGRPDASLGTGRPDASLGTGRPDALGRVSISDASLGTGRPDASLGTGRPDASLGTGRPDASLGTGRPDASLGTGRR